MNIFHLFFLLSFFLPIAADLDNQLHEWPEQIFSGLKASFEDSAKASPNVAV
ncbi:hypothetical protein SRA_03381 [Streptococcus ratti FA-1 = DSM 20564]|uniref:Uncharacterized protein n=1 Tax=Streptococcus ratti FA-1 = DSM 20564 TaxID=699248 RepID=A0ABN0GTD1_STRRT|nr:hypothetical protein SRA_03381 [Streptococcus ratti FA-1 = DSM 20564]